MIEIDGLYKDFGRFQLQISFLKFEKGKIYCLTGANGSGKSTLLNLIAMLIKPDKGSIKIDDVNIDFSDAKKIKKLRKKISYYIQSPYLFKTTVYNNAAYGLKLSKLNSNEIENKITPLLKQFKLYNIKNSSFHELSGGETARVVLARNISLDADIYLFDEPTANIDKNMVEIVEKELIKLAQNKQKTVILATHSEMQAERLNAEIIKLSEGKLFV